MKLMIKIICIFLTISGYGQTVTWDGNTDLDGADGVSWSDPLNWDLNIVPLATDDVIIGAGANVIQNVVGLTINALTVTGGTVNIQNDTSCTGAITINGGGTINLSGNLSTSVADQQYAIRVENGALHVNTYSLSANNSSGVYVDPTGTLTSGPLGGTIISTRSFRNLGTFNHGNGTIILSGTTNDTLPYAIRSANPLYNLTINRAIATSHTDIVDLPLIVENDLTNTSGDLRLNGQDLTIYGNLINSDAIIASGTEQIEVRGNVDFTGGTFTPVASTLLLTGNANTSFNPVGNSIYNITMNKNTDIEQVTLNSDFVLANNGTISATQGILDINNYNITGTATGTLLSVGANGTLELEANGQTINVASVSAAGMIRYDGIAGGTVFNVSYTNIEVAGGAYTFAGGGSLTVNGALTVTSGSIAIGNNGVSVSGITDIDGILTIGNQMALFTGGLTGTGSLTGGAGDIDINGNATISTFIEGAGNTNIAGDFTVTTFTNAGGTLIFDGAGAITSNGQNLGDMEIATDRSLGGALDCGSLTINAGTTLSSSGNNLTATALVCNGTFNALVGGDIQINGDVTNGGAGARTITGGVGTFNVTGNVSAEIFTSAGGNVDIDGTLTCTTFNQGAGSVSVGNAFTVGTFTDDVGELFLDGVAGTAITCANNLGNVTINANKTAGSNLQFANLTVSGGSTLSTGANALNVMGNAFGAGDLNCGGGVLDVNGDFTVTGNTTFSSATSNIGGNFTATGATFDANGGTLIFDGAGTINGNGKNLVKVQIATDRSLVGALICENLNINESTLTTGNNSLTVNANITQTGAGNLVSGNQPVTVTGNVDVTTFTGGAGAIDIGGFIQTGNFTASSTTTTVGGDFTVVGVFTHSGATVIFDNTGVISQTTMFNNLTITGGTRTLIGILTVANDLIINGVGAVLDVVATAVDVNRDIDIQAGNLTSSGAITVERNWSNVVGAGGFTGAGSTVTFDTITTATISGDTTFNNLTCTSPGKTINITAGTNQQVTGTMTLTGSPGNLVTLTSTGNWTLTNQGSVDADFVAVKYSQASASIAPVSCQDLGFNNANWAFSANPNNFEWLATASSNDWNTASNWNLGFVPNSGDNITILANAIYPELPALGYTANNLNISVAGASLDTMGENLIVNGAYSNSGTLRVRGTEALMTNVDFSQGTFNYYHTADAPLQALVYNNLVISGTATYSTAGVTTINGSLTISGTGKLSMGYNVTVTGTLTMSNGFIDVDAYALDINGTRTLTGGVINISTGTLDLQGNPTVLNGTNITLLSNGVIDSTGEDFTLSNGSIDAGSNTDALNCSALAISGGIFTASSSIITCATFSQTNGIFNGNTSNIICTGATFSTSSGTFNAGTSKVIFNGTLAQAFNPGVSTYYDIEINNGVGGSVTLSNDLNIAHDFINTTSSFTHGSRLITFNGTSTQIFTPGTSNFYDIIINNGGGGSVSLSQDLNITHNLNITSATFTHNSNKVIFNGSTAQTITTGGTGAGRTFYDIEVNSTDIVSLSALNDLKMDTGGTLTLTNGTLALNNKTLSLGNPFTLSSATSTLAIGTGTFNGYDGTSYYNITQNSGTISHDSGTLVGNDVSINGVTYILTNTGAIFSVYGNFTIAGAATWTANSGDVTMYTAGSTVNINKGLGASILNLTANSAGAVSIVTNPLFMSGDFYLQTGTFTQNGLDMTVGGTFTIDDTTTYTASTLNVAGDFTLNATSTFTKGGTLSFTASGDIKDGNAVLKDLGDVVITAGTRTQTSDLSMTNLTINGENITGDYNLTVASNVDSSAGTITASGQTAGKNINIGGNFTSGIFTAGAGAGTLNFNGSGATQVFTPNSGTFGIAQTSGVAVVQINGTSTFSSFTTSAGNSLRLDGSSAACTVNIASGGTFTNDGSLVVNDSGNPVTLKSAAGTAIFTGTDINYNGKKIFLSGIDYQTDVTLEADETIQLSGDCSFTNININNATASFIDGAQTFNITGDWSNAGTCTMTGTANFNGVAAQDIISGGTAVAKQFNILNHNGTGTLRIVTNDIYIKSTFTNSSDIFNLNGLNMTVVGALTISGGTFDASIGTPTIYVGSNWEKNGAGLFTAGISTVNFTGNGSIVNAETFYNMTVSSGTRTLGAAINPTITHDLSITGGIFQAGARIVFVGHDWNRSGVGLFTAGSSTVNFNGTGVIVNDETFFNLTVSAGTRTQTLDITVTNDVLITGTGNYSPGLLKTSVGRHWTNSNTFTPGSSRVIFNGTVNQTFIPGVSNYYSMQVNNTGGAGSNTVQLSTNDLTLNAGGILTLTAGVLNLNSQNLTINTSPTLTGGVIDLNSNIITAIGVAIDVNGTSINNANNSGTINCGNFKLSSGSVNNTLNPVTLICGDFTIAGGTYKAFGSPITASGNVDLTGGTFDVSGGVSTLTMTGLLKILKSNNQSIDNLRINGGTVTINTNDLTMNNDLTIETASSLTTGSNSLFVTGNVVLNGTGLLDAGGQGVGKSVSVTGSITDDVANQGQYKASPQNTTVSGVNFDVTNFNHNSGILTFSGAAAQNFYPRSSVFYSVIVNKTNTVLLLLNNLTAVGNILISNGTLDTGLVDIYAHGNITNFGTFTARSQTVNITGATDTQTLDLGSSNLNNLEVNKTASINTVTILNTASDLTISGTLTITQGILVQNRNLTVNGTATIVATGEWRNITDTANANITFGNTLGVGCTLNVEAGGKWTVTAPTNLKTVTIANTVTNAGTITFNGGASDNISIVSSNPGVDQKDWAGTGVAPIFTMNDVTVRDQTCTSGTPARISHDGSHPGTDNGNNINWFIGDKTISGTLYTDKGVTAAGAGVNLTLYVYLNGVTRRNRGTVTTAPDGSFSITQVSYTAGDIILITDIDGSIFTMPPAAGNITGCDLYRSHVIVRNDNLGLTTTANMGTITNFAPEIIPANAEFDVTGANLVLEANRELLVWTGMTYTPGGTITTSGTGGLDIRGTLTAGGVIDITGNGGITVSGLLTTSGNVTCTGTGGVTITATGKLTASLTDTLSFGGSWGRATGGVWTPNSSTVNITGTPASTLTAGETFHNLTINKTSSTNMVTSIGALTVNNDLTVTSGTFDSQAGNLTVKRDITMNGVNAVFSPGATDVFIARNWILTSDATFTAGLSSVIFNSDLATVISGDTIFYKLIFSKGTGTVSIGCTIIASYFGAYRGAVSFSGNYNLTVNGDVALLGAGNIDSLASDNWAGPLGYISDNVHHPASYTASFDFSGQVIHMTVTGDFYVNGANMISTAPWFLHIPENDDDIRKARAYGEMNVRYSQADYWVAASGGTLYEDGTLNDDKIPVDLFDNVKWDFGRLVISGVETRSDSVLYIGFGTGVENDNNEINTVFSGGTIKYNDNSIPFSGTYTDFACTVSTNGQGDMTGFYIKAPTTWNTDATGLSAGTATSTDRDGVHKTVKTNIRFNEATILRRNTKTRMPAISVDAVDLCPPVLISSVLDNTLQRTNGAAKYTFNSVKLTFSEPIQNNSFPTTADVVSDNDGDVSDGGAGAAINTAGVISGWGNFAVTGNVVTHSDSTTNGGTSDSNVIFTNTDRTNFTILLGGNYNDGGCIRSVDGTALVQPSGIYTPLATIRDNSLSHNLIDTAVTRTTSGNWALTNIPQFTETKTDERTAHINGRIDNYILKFNEDIQMYDGNGSVNGQGTHTIVAENFTHSYIAEVADLNLVELKKDAPFNLNLIEISMSYNFGDTGELPLLSYLNSSVVKFISTNYRLEMGNGHTNSAVRVDGAEPVVYGVDLSIDDPDEHYVPSDFNSSPYYNHLTDTYQDPGAAPEFNMHRSNPAPYSGTTVPFTDRSYRNKIRFTFSEDLDLASIGIPLNTRASGYTYTNQQKSEFTNSNFGNSTVTANGLYFSGLGTLKGCNLSSDAGTNFVQFETERELFVHLTGWYDLSTQSFPGAINSVTTVPRIEGTDYFDTNDGALNLLVKDTSGNSIQAKDTTNSDVEITVTKDWDISKPVFRYIAKTASFSGDPLAGGSDLTSGVSGGNPVDTIEFIMNEAIFDLKENVNLTGVFTLNFIDNDAEPLSPPLFTTGIVKLGRWTNNMMVQSDTDSNDQAFSIKFTSNKPDYKRIRWSYLPKPDIYITDLRGNRLSQIVDKITIETAPPFIVDTRAVVGSNSIYVEFNEDVSTMSGGDIDPSNFQVLTSNGIAITSIKPFDSKTIRKDQFLFTFNMPLSDDIIATDLFSANPGAVKDTLDNVMREDINYKLSSIGINFFLNTLMEDYYRKGDAWVVKNFDGSEKITPDSLKITTNVDVEKYRGMLPLLYYDIFDTREDAAFWFPNKNKSARQIVGRNIGDTRWEFLLPANDPKIKIGSYMAMVFKIGDFYSYRSIYPIDSDSFTPKEAESYLVKIERFKEQRDGVTILNNLINPTKNEIVKVSYKLEKAGPVSIIVYDLAGNVVKDLTTEFRAAGQHLVEWNGKNTNGKIVARGVYLVRVRAPGIFNQIRKVLVVK